MSTIGRNQPCHCGSGRKSKRCCGVQRGPSDAELAKAFLVTRSREAARRLVGLARDDLLDLFDEMLELPRRHLSLQLPLPRLMGPELDALGYAVEDDDLELDDERIGSALDFVDTPQLRRGLAEATVALAKSGLVNTHVADTAIVDLARRSSSLMRASLLEAVSVSVGSRPTPSGLLVVSL